MFDMRNRRPLVSFTFDDFPRSALHTGGAILEHYGTRGTYYCSLGLMGQTAPSGEMFNSEDLWQVLERGHDLGCHTYHHCHACDTPADKFEESVLENRKALQNLVPDAEFTTLSYPISFPRPATKARCAKYFSGCRAGGQTFNAGRMDLNAMRAFFLEQSRDHLEAIKALINENNNAGGWLIFATHDVCDHPTRFGCLPEFFRAVVEYSVKSGSLIVPVSRGLEEIGVPTKVTKSLPKPRALGFGVEES